MSYAGARDRYSDFYGDPYGESDDAAPHKRRVTRVFLALIVVAAMVLVGAAAFAGTVLLGGGAGTSDAAQGNGQAPDGVTIGDPSLPGGFAEDSPGPTPEETPPATEPEPTPTTAPAPAPSRTRATQATKPPAGSGSAQQRVLVLVNQERAEVAQRTGRACPALSIDSRLTTAAQLHSEDMANRGYFAHDTPEGVNVGQRVINAKYNWSTVGENIAKGQQNADSVMQAWMNSPGHAANITNCRFVHIGIGLASAGRSPVWTQDFGALR